MELERPKPKRVYITAVDPDGELPSKSTTVYGTTPEKAIEEFERFVGSKSKPRKEAATA